MGYNKVFQLTFLFIIVTLERAAADPGKILGRIEQKCDSNVPPTAARS